METKLYNVALKVLEDGEFAHKLVQFPVETLKSEGVEATPEILEALKGVQSADLQKLADGYKRGNIAAM
jgi:hypothetical protein